ncbi:MAG TPA: hypothetical protein VF369_07085 [candidate division Zixibacteria bacterium]
MLQKRMNLVGLTALFILLWCTSIWADSSPTEIDCFSEQFSVNPKNEVGFSSKAGVLRNRVLLEIFTATN